MNREPSPRDATNPDPRPDRLPEEGGIRPHQTHFGVEGRGGQARPNSRARCTDPSCLHLVRDHDGEYCRKCRTRHPLRAPSTKEAFDSWREETLARDAGPFVPLGAKPNQTSEREQE